MIAAAMIVKPSVEEALLLDRCLASFAKDVDGIFITITGNSPEVEAVARKYGAKISYFDWIHDFSAARNFNFAQISKEYGSIFWCDADDVIRGSFNLRKEAKKIDEGQTDLVVLEYEYSFDSDGNCIAIHDKTRIVKNDGCVQWYSEIHEDFQPLRECIVAKSKDITVVHQSTDDRYRKAAVRNLEIAKMVYEKRPNDPRSHWLLANGYASPGIDQHAESVKWWQVFVKKTSSQVELFAAYIRLSNSAREVGDLQLAKQCALEALLIRPEYPDAFYSLADTLIREREYEKAISLIYSGMRQRTPEAESVAFNPREYDLRPAKMLYEIFLIIGDIERAKYTIEKIYELVPSQKNESQLRVLDKELDRIQRVKEEVAELSKITDDKTVRTRIEKLDDDLRSHPAVVALWNKRFTKTESTGRDIVYYCSYTSHAWNPEIAEKEGVGGSEEAVIHLAKRWVKLGWNVTVYANTGLYHEKTYDGVVYKPFWSFNPRDKNDIAIIWRSAKPIDYDINADKIFVDLHDVVPKSQSREFSPDRQAQITSLMVKSEAHKRIIQEWSHYDIPDERFTIVPNGIDPDQFRENVVRDPYLLLNTSSADRSLPTLLDLYEQVLLRLPVQTRKKVKLAWYYGWQVFDNDYKTDQTMQAFKNRTLEKWNELEKQGYVQGGTKLNHREIARAYQQAGAFVYPTRFFEIHCISAIKAQVAGAVPLATDFAALEESIQFGVKVPVAKGDWDTPRGTDFGIKDKKEQEAWIRAVVAYLKNPQKWDKEREKMRVWAIESYDWNKIAASWIMAFVNE